MRITGSRQVLLCAVMSLIALLTPAPASGQPKPKFTPIPPPAPGQPKPDMRTGIAFSSDQAFLGTCGTGVRIYDVKTGKLLRDIDGGTTQAIAFSPAVADLFAAGGDDGILRLWNVGKADVVREFRGHDGMIESIAFDKSGQYVASTSMRGYRDAKPSPAFGQFRLWELKTGKVVQSLDVKDGEMQGVSFSGDGKLVALCRNLHDKASHVEVYQVQPWKLAASIKLFAAKELETTQWGQAAPFGWITAFEPDQKRLLVVGGICSRADPTPYKFACKTIGLIWRVELTEPSSAKVFEDSNPRYYRSLGLAPDAKRFVTGNEGPQNYTFEQRVEDTPGGKMLVSVIREKPQIQMRDVVDGKLIWSVDSDAPLVITMSPDGELVAACQREGVLLLNAKTGKKDRVIPWK